MCGGVGSTPDRVTAENELYYILSVRGDSGTIVASDSYNISPFRNVSFGIKATCVMWPNLKKIVLVTQEPLLL